MTENIEQQSENNAAAYQYAVAFHTEYEDRNPYQVSVIFELHAIISRELYDFAGKERTVIHEVEIGGASIDPVPAHLIITSLADLCSDAEIRAKSELTHGEAIQLSAEILHKLLCIHPFQDGNGRTARAFHLITLYNLGILHPPQQIFDFIAMTRDEYLRCLHEADEGDYRPLCSYIMRGVFDAIEQDISDLLRAEPFASTVLPYLDRRAKKFMNRRHRLRLAGKTYERENLHFFESIKRFAERAAKRLATRPKIEDST